MTIVVVLAWSGLWLGFSFLWSLSLDQELNETLQSEKETRSRFFNTVFANSVVERRLDTLRSTAEAFLSDERSQIASIQIYDAQGRKLADVGAVQSDHVCNAPDELSLESNHTFLKHEVDLELEGMRAGRLIYIRSYRGLLETHDRSLRASFWLTLANTLTFLLVLAGAVGWLLKQERQLAAAVNEIAKGDIDSVPDGLPSGGPIGRIARRVEDMAARLRTRDRDRLVQEQIREKLLDELKTAQYRQEASLEAGALGTWEWSEEEQTLRVDDRWLSLHGLERSALGRQLTREEYYDKIHPEDHPKVQAAFQEYVNGDTDTFEVEIRKFTPVGDMIWVRLTGGSPTQNEPGDTDKIYGVTKNVSVEKRVQERLVMFRQVFSNAHEAIAITNSMGSILEVNAAFSEMVGKTIAEVQYLRLRDIPEFASDIEDRERWFNQTNTDFDSLGVVSREFHIGSLPVWATGHLVRNDRGETVGRAIFLRDMTEKHEEERTLKRLANLDSLTGLANRRYFDSELGVQMKQHSRAATKMALLYIDLDEFKAVNDTLGHAAGDQLLADVAQCLRSTLREGDVVARLGGDEFGVIVTHVKSSDAVSKLGSKLVERVAKLDVQATRLKIGASVGAAIFPDDADTSHRLQRLADDAMYDAKKAGKNTVRMASATSRT